MKQREAAHYPAIVNPWIIIPPPPRVINLYYYLKSQLCNEI
jgi:hypothetical protein